MTAYLRNHWAFLLFVLAVSAAYLAGTAAVPFHPDESTQIFMSGDLEIFLQDPRNLFYQPDAAQPLRQHYRLLDAPLARTLIALGRQIAGFPPPQADWDWSKDWEENRQAGALPVDRLLLTARIMQALLFPFSLILFFETARAAGGSSLGWLSAGLLASNALVLLHTRRAMAEGVLLFASILALWWLVRFRKIPWLLALPVALAFNAKQTSAGLVLVGAAALLWPSGKTLLRHLTDILLYTLLFSLVTLLLNPFLWSDPVTAFLAAVDARAQFIGRQEQFILYASPGQWLGTWLERLVALVSHLFIAPPAIADVGNYLQQTQSAEAAYLSNPLHRLFRGLAGGAAIMILSGYGFFLALLDSRKAPPARRRVVTLLVLATLVQFLALLAALPVPYQRYYLPLAPFVCLWSGYGILKLAGLLVDTRHVLAK